MCVLQRFRAALAPRAAVLAVRAARARRPPRRQRQRPRRAARPSAGQRTLSRRPPPTARRYTPHAHSKDRVPLLTARIIPTPIFVYVRSQKLT